MPDPGSDLLVVSGYDAHEEVGVAADVLGGGVHAKVSAKLKRALEQETGRERVQLLPIKTRNLALSSCGSPTICNSSNVLRILRLSFLSFRYLKRTHKVRRTLPQRKCLLREGDCAKSWKVLVFEWASSPRASALPRQPKPDPFRTSALTV